jgi:hypothetical protein
MSPTLTSWRLVIKIKIREFSVTRKLGNHGDMKSIHDPRYVEMVNHLKQVRKGKSISQVDLGERMGWDQRDISKVESFIRRLDFIELCDWLTALEYDLEDFMKEIGQLPK